MSTPMFLITNTRPSLAYRQIAGNQPAGVPGIVFLCGHGSDMEGTKAIDLEEWALKQGYDFLRFDYSGHGLSEGEFLQTNISDWTADALAVIDQLTEGPQILVGSSLGGWIMLNVAVARPDRIAGLVGIAAAPDFTDDLIWDHLTPDQQSQMQADGQIALPNPYSDEPVIYPYHLITDGRQHFRLRGRLDITAPVRLLHGMQDAEVPWQTATRIADCMTGTDVEITHVQSAGHRFSEPDQLALIRDKLGELIAITS